MSATASGTSSGAAWRYSLMNLGMVIPAQVSSFFTLYYVDHLKVDPVLWAGLIGLLALYNAVDNPLIGHLSDRTRTRWGRRLPYLMFATAPSLVALALLFSSPTDAVANQVLTLAWFLVMWLLWETAGTAMGSAYLSLLPEMFTSFAERSRVAVRMNAVQVVGLLIGLALPLVLVSRIGWTAMGIAFAAIALVAVYQGLGVLRENAPTDAPRGTLRGALRDTFTNRSFLTVVLALTMRFVATGALATGMGFYIKYSLAESGDLGGLLLALAFVVAGLFLWPWRRLAADRFGARGTLLASFAVTGLGAVGLGFARSLPLVVAATVVIGIGLSGMILMGDVIMADVIDAEEARTGERRAGAFYGLAGLITTLSGAVVAAAFGWVSLTFGYDPKLEAQPERVADGFRLFMAAVPALGCLLAIVLLWFYPLHGERLAQMRARLAEVRAAS